MDHAEHRAERELATDLEPWVELLPRPAVHPDLAALAALSSSDQHCAAGAIEVALLESKRLADAQAGPPEQHDQRAESVAVGAITEDPHHRDDLLDRRRVSRVLLALVTRRAASVIARHGRRRAAVSGDVQQHGFYESPFVGRVDIALLFEPRGVPNTEEPPANRTRPTRGPRVCGCIAAGVDVPRPGSKAA
jgi:hypothetical protein